jgi:hypothetical protein
MLAMITRTLLANTSFAVSLFVTVAAAGCAAIVDADGYSVDKPGSGGSGGGSGGNTGGNTGGKGGGTGGGGGSTGGGMPSSGESVCMGNTCPTGQQCVMTSFSPPGICGAACPSGSGCDAQHDCVGSTDPTVTFPNTCLKRCTVAAPCPANMICIEISTGESVCMPLGWDDELGIGDNCVVDAQCVSGTCRNKPNGWCSKSCGAADALCAHDATDFPNRTGELNWCVSTQGANLCVPGCDTGGSDTCAVYPGTTCKPITDITGDMQKACLP